VVGHRNTKHGNHPTNITVTQTSQVLQVRGADLYSFCDVLQRELHQGRRDPFMTAAGVLV